jgi:hypothetical protein
VTRTKVPPACLLGIAGIVSVLIFAPSAGRGKINFEGLLAPLRVEETGPNPDERGSTMDFGSSWRLVQTPRRDGPGEVSIAQTADATRSDVDLAGLMLRCSNAGFDVLVIFLKPFPPRAHPKVKLITGGNTMLLDGAVISPGAAILLPTEAVALVNGSWQSSSELAIEVDDGRTLVRGVISLAGLGPALSLLRSSCAPR